MNESDVNKILEFLCGEDIFTERRSKDKLYLKVKGIATHAMNPEKGKNALSELLQILKNLSEYIGFTANATKSIYMFLDCELLVGGAGTKFDSNNKTDKTYARIDGGTSAPGYLTKKN